MKKSKSLSKLITKKAKFNGKYCNIKCNWLEKDYWTTSQNNRFCEFFDVYLTVQRTVDANEIQILRCKKCLKIT